MNDITPSPTSEQRRSKVIHAFVEGVKLVLPTLLTAVIGFFIWNEQSKIQQKIADNNRLIEQKATDSNRLMERRLNRSEEFYKRRLDVYTATCREVVAVKDALDQAHLDTKQAVDSLASLDRFRRSNALYISDQLENTLRDIWGTGANLMQNLDDEKNEELKSEITQSIVLAYDCMKEDLSVKELSQALSGVAEQPK